MNDISAEVTHPYFFMDDLLKEDLSQVRVQVGISAQSGQDAPHTINVRGAQIESEFLSNLWAWNRDTEIRSVNNYDSSYFDAIVKMKEEAIPLIYRELLKGPTPLVHALDQIYEGEVEYHGYLPLEFVCMIWLEILKAKGISA